MTPTERRAWILGLARASCARLEDWIEVLEDGHHKNRDLEGFGARIEDAYYALYGDRKTLRWLLFVRAIENGTHIVHLTPRFRVVPNIESDSSVARNVIQEYGVVFPDAAKKLRLALVTNAVRAWRADLNYFDAIRKALLPAYSAGQKPKLPSARSLATKWSEFNKNTPWRAPSNRRQRRRPKVSRGSRH